MPYLWESELLRFTIFLSTPDLAAAASFEAITGDPPEGSLERREQRIRSEEGRWGEDGLLSVQVQPGRVDIVLRPLPELASASGAFEAGWRRAHDLCETTISWLVGSGLQVSRLAFGSVLIIPVSDRVTGYRIIAGLLPQVNLDGETSSDFMYQINRPRPSSGAWAGATINRLSKWSVAARVRVPADVLAKLSEVVPSYIPETDHFCRLELDINTRPVAERIPEELLAPMLRELLTLGKEIAEQGDRP